MRLHPAPWRQFVSAIGLAVVLGPWAFAEDVDTGERTSLVEMIRAASHRKKGCDKCDAAITTTIPDATTPREALAPATPPPAVDTTATDQALASALDLASTSQTVSPNMMGDFFGQGVTQITQTGPVQATFYLGDPNNPGALLAVPITSTPPSAPAVLTAPGYPPFLSVANSDNIFQNVPIPLQQNAGFTAGLPVPPQAAAVAQFVSSLASPQSGGTPGAFINDAPPGTLFYTIAGTYFFPYGLVPVINAPAPGATISSSKINENDSPIPRDRVFFNYNYFNNAFGILNVHRYTFGAEKTFFNGWSSIETRIPFASTLDATQVAGGTADDIEFGNVPVIFKQLLIWGSDFALSTGMGITTPTAAGTRVSLFGTPLVNIANRSVHAMPYVGAVWNPTNARWFTQGFCQLDFDTNGNPVNVLGANGRLQSASFAYLSGAFGYFVYRNDAYDGWINQVTPLVELHYNGSMQKGDNFTSNGVAVGDFFNNLNILSTTLGVNLLVRQNTFVTLGCGLPLTNGVSRQYDWEAMAQVNIRFGNSRLGFLRNIPNLQ